MPAGTRSSAELQVVLYTKAGCHLCDDLLAQLHAMQQSLEFTVVERDIEDDAEDFARFQYLIPVLDVPGAELLCPPHDAGHVRETVAAALRTSTRIP